MICRGRALRAILLWVGSGEQGVEAPRSSPLTKGQVGRDSFHCSTSRTMLTRTVTLRGWTRTAVWSTPLWSPFQGQRHDAWEVLQGA